MVSLDLNDVFGGDGYYYHVHTSDPNFNDYRYLWLTNLPGRDIRNTGENIG